MTKSLVTLIVASVLFLGAEVRAQESASSGIVGRVVDATQGALPGATVIATNVGTSAERTATTDAEGRFSILGLPAATYRLRVELVGFEPAVLDELVLRLGQIASPVVSLRLAGLAETMTVQGQAPLLETASAAVVQVVAEKQLRELPTVDRSVLQLMTLAAGVSGVAKGNLAKSFGINYVTVDGGRDSSTNYTIDGVIVRSQRFNKMSILPPLDAVQEVNLLRNSFSTEYGQGQAVLALVTKSGTNTFRGTISDYFRNERLNARNYFEPAGTSKAPFRRNIVDTTFGGPIVRNRTFVFGSYQGGRRKESQTLLNIVPDPRFVSGDFSSLSTPIIDPLTGGPFPGNVVPKDRFSNYSKVIAPLIPAPNAPRVSNFVRTGNIYTDSDIVTVRLDQTLNTNHSLFQRFLWNNPRLRSENAVNISVPPEDERNLALGHTWVLSPTLVNEVRFGYNYFRQYGQTVPYNASDATRDIQGEIGIRNILGATTTKYGPPLTTITGYTALPAWGAGQGVREETYSFSNATSKTLKRHTLRFGIQGQYRRFFLDTPFSQQGAFSFTGAFTGNAIADFLLGYCGVCAGLFGTGDGDFRSPTVAPFFNDIWRVNNRLTLQTGVRWEYLGPWVDINNRQGTFDPTVGKVGYNKVPANIPPALEPLIIRQDGHFGRGILQKDLNNWGPRVGATFEVNNRTLIRTGFGIYFDNVDLNEVQFTRTVPPFAGIYSIVPDQNNPVDAATLFPDLNFVTRFPGALPVDPKSRTPYLNQWNASVQRSMGRDYVVEVAYTGSRGRNLNKRYPVNQPLEGTAPLTQRLPYPQWDQMIGTANDGYSDFAGLSVRGEKRFAAGWSFVSSYQISRNRDNGSGTQDCCGPINGTAFERDKAADYGYSNFYQKHRGTVSFIYELPFGKERHWLTKGPAADVLGGWQVAGLIHMQSGSPFTVTGPNVCRCGQQVPNRVNFAPGREEDKGQLDNPTPERWFDVTAFVVPNLGFQGRAGRNFLFGPAFRTVDVSISRMFMINLLRLDFRGEVYNLLNTTNFDNPVADISNRNVAHIISAGDPRIVQLSLRAAW